MGDSIAEGDGSTNGGQWWKLLVNDLEARHPGLYLYPNLITKGGTGLAYAEQQVAATDLTPYRGAVAFVNVGANDGTSLLAGTVTAGDYATRYAALLSTLRNAGLRLIVSTYPEPLVDSAGSMILPIIRQAAGADLLDLWQAFHDLGAARNQALHADNVHLNDDGQIEMAQLVEAELERRGLLP